MAFRHRGRRWLPWVGLAASLFVIAVAAMVVVLTGREGDVSNPDVEFSQTETQSTTHGPAQKPPPRGKHPADDGFRWPGWGYDDARTRVLGLQRNFRPPFRIAWRKHMHQLLEFTAVSCKRSVFVLGDAGDLYKVSRWTGQVQWKRHLGSLAAASPACDGKGVYAVLLRRAGSADGRVVALGADKGRVRWSRRLGGRAESSPLIHKGVVYFGVEDGNVFALRARTGKLVWRFHARGAVKGALALSKGRLFFGTYGGSVYSLRASNGRQRWRNDVAEGGAFGIGGGNFYSTAAVEYGRVYLGATNGAIYSLSARTGKLAWRKVTNNYVYASPAVGAVAGGPPTVWVGSYNGSFYALDAQTGAIRWSRKLGGKLSGSPTVIGDLVFQSAFDKRFTWALGANTGRILWKFNRGAFTAAISDGRRIYFNGYGTLYALDPKGFRFTRRALPRGTPARRHAAQRKHKAAKRKRAKPHRSAAKRRFCRHHRRAKRCRRH
jgi:outer membrane protein assembly factor BamB